MGPRQPYESNWVSMPVGATRGGGIVSDAMRQAFEQVRRGCVHTPCSDGAIGKIDELLQRLEHLWSPKEWRR